MSKQTAEIMPAASTDKGLVFASGKTDDPRLFELAKMLTYCRPSDSFSETQFIAQFIEPLNPEQDDFGNFIVRVGDNPSILFSSHTDSVHAESGRQDVLILNESGKIEILDQRKHSCLGADCATGVWIMINMIRAQIQGVYIFHRGEEIGGLGSNYIARMTPDILSGLDAAVAFDRRGMADVITHQADTRCCSDEFADSLASILAPNVTLKRDDTGIFTDTANYTNLIGECTNISVGYCGAHSSSESQDFTFAISLLDSLLKADWSKLVLKRKPGERETDKYCWRDHYGDDDFVKTSDSEFEEISYFVWENSDVIAEFLIEHGISTKYLKNYAKERKLDIKY